MNQHLDNAREESYEAVPKKEGQRQMARKSVKSPALQFGIRGLVIGITLIAVFVAHRSNVARHQDHVIAIVQRHGGHIAYDYQFTPHGGFDVMRVSSTPHWLRSVCGDSFFQNVRFVICEGEAIPESDFISLVEHMKHLPRLRRIHLSDITNRVMKGVGLLRQVTDVHVAGAEIDDNGLRSLASLDKLRVLALYYTSVSPEGVTRLKEELPTVEVFVR